MASLQTQPISEWDTQAYISALAFPTLFPNGQALFNHSRSRVVKIDDYHRHLLLYKDDRFARHPQFRYWVFNTMKREQARKSTKFMWKGSEESNLTYDELKEIVDNPDSHLHDKIARQASTIRGTRPYWMKRRDDLEAMVVEFGTKAAFFTLSAADLQWNDLYQQLPEHQYREYFDASEEQRGRLATQFVQ